MDTWQDGTDEPTGDGMEAQDAPPPWSAPDAIAAAPPRWSQDDAGPMYWLLKALAEKEAADREAVEALLRSL